ncbi:hypothetical protein [Rhizobium giardinii]|uniref:hypothetical protein n=1 Tax=Rhizobium giardinii TaxID=56731 RepID=UPI003D6DB7E3
MIRHPEVIVFKIKGVRTGEVCRLIVDDILSQTKDWIGPATCAPVFKLSFVRPEQSEDVVWPEVMIPHDTDAIARLLIASDEIESIQHKRNFLPNEKLKPRVKKKPEPKGPFSARGHDLSKYRPSLHPFFDNPDLVAEADDLRGLMKGYPFKDKSPLENSRWIEMEVIHRLRDRFPTLYDLDIVLGGVIKESLTLTAKPDIQRHGTLDDFNLAHCFGVAQPPNVVHSHLACLRRLDWMIRTGRLKEFRDRKSVDPTDDEAAEDRLFHIHAVGRGVTSDRAYVDDLLDEEEMAAADAAEPGDLTI